MLSKLELAIRNRSGSTSKTDNLPVNVIVFLCVDVYAFEWALVLLLFCLQNFNSPTNESNSWCTAISFKAHSHILGIRFALFAFSIQMLMN